MGFTVSSHICGGKKVKTVFSMSNADVSCGMEEVEIKCDTETQIKSNCCKDEFRLMQIDADYTQQLTRIDFSNDFLIAFAGVYFDLFKNTTTDKDFFNNHSPPPLIKDIPVLIQSFLI
ncbi:MAG: hypothetical protein COA97_12545 [Flavobacteriales bacterium]|nr:MAG: hypothetical protein COA97_12545 [Flavobacteriales bacterium]